MGKATLLILALLFGSPLLAQDHVVQLRTPVHITKKLGENWFLAGWMIGNVRQAQPDNINLFGGLGYKRNNWWLETLVQRQWSTKGHQWQLNFRFNRDFGKRANLYLELYPVSSRRSFSEVVIFDYRLSDRWKIGVETENLHKRGRDSYGGGSRLSFRLVNRGPVTLWVTGTYHFRNQGEPRFFRTYVITTVRF